MDVKVWRCSQPQKYQFAGLAKDHGIGEVLCLRRWHSDEEKAEDLHVHHVRMSAGSIRDEQVVAALRVLVSAEKPVVVHCLHGSDRTGAVVAMYRMVVQRWTREKAIAEFADPQYGHHADWFPNIRQYLETADIEAVRRQVFDKAVD